MGEADDLRNPLRYADPSIPLCFLLFLVNNIMDNNQKLQDTSNFRL
jgi:hypothetical protein